MLPHSIPPFPRNLFDQTPPNLPPKPSSLKPSRERKLKVVREEEKKRGREKKKRKFGEARRFATPRNHRIDSLISDNGDTHGEERRRARIDSDSSGELSAL